MFQSSGNFLRRFKGEIKKEEMSPSSTGFGKAIRLLDSAALGANLRLILGPILRQVEAWSKLQPSLLQSRTDVFVRWFIKLIHKIVVRIRMCVSFLKSILWITIRIGFCWHEGDERGRSQGERKEKGEVKRIEETRRKGEKEKSYSLKFHPLFLHSP